jgi:hypothetical protein
VPESLLGFARENSAVGYGNEKQTELTASLSWYCLKIEAAHTMNP